MAKRLFKYLLLIVVAFLLSALILAFVPPLWRHWISYPRLEKQLAEFQKMRVQPDELTALNLFRGVMHAHSFWSHDSEGTLHDLIPAAKINGIDFIFLTDHPHGNLDTFPRGYRGFYDGVLIEPGSEKQGFAAWPLDSVVIDWKENKDSIAKNIVSNGGLLFYAHTEEAHNWANPHYQGMEIYNIHTDTKDERLLPHLLNFLVNGKKYRHWAMRELFDEQTAILALWDSLNTVRKIVGFSAVDTHENQNIRARKMADDRIELLGPNANPIDTFRLNFWNRWLFNEPDENGWVMKWMIDTYASGFNYITNYVFADSLSVQSLSEHMKKGHLYTAFKSLADAKGFLFYAMNGQDSIHAILGDSIPAVQVKSLNAVSPFPGQFRLIHNGKTIDISTSDNYRYSWQKTPEKGAYRIEIHIRLKNNHIPWLYSNPIYIY